MKDSKVKFDLQLFSDKGQADSKSADETAENVDTETTEKQEEVKTYTQEEVDALTKNLLSQDEVDKIVEKRIARERQKAEDEKKEAERLSKLSADERAKEESKKKDDEIARLRAEIDRNNLEKDTIDRLNQEELPLEFKSFLMREDAEKTNEAIKTFKDVYNKAIQEEVEKRFRGKTPKGSSQATKTDVWSSLSQRYQR